jgi:hypothetical protein
MTTSPLIEDNVIVENPLDPTLAWTIQQPYNPTQAATDKLTRWCERHGLDSKLIPATGDGLVVRLESPDGGLVAHVVEYVVDENGRRHIEGGTWARHAPRTIPVDSIPPAGGYIPTWAAQFATTEETR